ncbi:MAG TPA: response regulator transcription factor [Acidobacteriaceae bacterium]|nr:response regulator transcription factor [Acidobacteriaceae bacterium]
MELLHEIELPHVSRLLISDRTPLGCELMARGLESSIGQIQLVARATSGPEVLRLAQEHKPDIALVSAVLSDGPLAGFKTLPVLQSMVPRCSVIVLLDEMDVDLVVDAFRAHARGIFFRAEPIENLIKCINAVHEGQVWVGSRELRLVLDAFSESAPFHVPTSAGLNLTRRELDIATLVAAGKSNRQISRSLNISEHTVKNNLFRIFEKIGVGSRVELAVFIMNVHQYAPFRGPASLDKLAG